MTDERLKEDKFEKEKNKEEVKETTSDKAEPESKKEKKDKFQKTIERLNLDLKKVEEDRDTWKEKCYRVLAELDNQKKQYAKDYQSVIKYQSQNLAEKLIPSFEMFSMVIESADKLPPEVSSYVVGFDMIYRQMLQAFESENIKEIKVAIGDEFDHKVHYAVETEDVEDDSLVNKVLKIIRKGYMIHDRLIKPATVIVGKKKVQKEEEIEKDEASSEEAKA